MPAVIISLARIRAAESPEENVAVRVREFEQHQEDQGDRNIFREMPMAADRDEKARRLMLLAEGGTRFRAGTEPDLGPAALA